SPTRSAPAAAIWRKRWTYQVEWSGLDLVIWTHLLGSVMGPVCLLLPGRIRAGRRGVVRVRVALRRAGGPGRQSGQIPERARRWLPRRWVSTMPTASMRANIVVGPTCRKPRARSASARATDSGEVVGTSARVRGRGVRAGRKD